MEKFIRLIFNISLISLFLEITLCFVYTIYFGLNRTLSDDDKQLPEYLMVALTVSGIVFVIALLILSVFQVIYIYRIHGRLGLFITGIMLVIIFVASLLFYKVFLEEYNYLKNSFILTMGVMSLILMTSYYIRIKKGK